MGRQLTLHKLGVGLAAMLLLLSANSCGSTPLRAKADRALPLPAPMPPSPSIDPTSPLEPFAILSPLQFGPPEAFMAAGERVIGSFSSPVNSAESDRDYFTAPEFDRGENSGRLFAVEFTLGPADGDPARWRYQTYITWQPLNDRQGRAQQLRSRPGLRAVEVTIDGQGLVVHHEPLEGTQPKAAVDRYRWQGDAFGKGAFVLVVPSPVKSAQEDRSRP